MSRREQDRSPARRARSRRTAWTRVAGTAVDGRDAAAKRACSAGRRRLDVHLAAAQEAVRASHATRRRSSSAVSALRGAGTRPAPRTAAPRRRRRARWRGRSRSALSSDAFDQARRLGFVGEIEAGIDAGFERELVEQRQAERVDGADADVAEAHRGSRATLAGVSAALAVPLPQRRHHALAHLGRGLAREGDRQDVARRRRRLRASRT